MYPGILVFKSFKNIYFNYVLHVCVSISARRCQRHWIPLELELQAVASHLTWVLRPSTRAVMCSQPLNHFSSSHQE